MTDRQLNQVLERHPLNRILPPQDHDLYEAMKIDIHGRGLNHPITLFDGMVLDGWHRYRACLELGLEPWFEQFEGPGSAWDLVRARNLLHLHMTPEEIRSAKKAGAELHVQRCLERMKASQEAERVRQAQIRADNRARSARKPPRPKKPDTDTLDMFRDIPRPCP